MTRDADIARIAAALHEFKVGCVHVAAFLHESQHRDDAERLYDAGLRPSVEPPLSERESADGAHMPRPSDICSVCGNGLVHIDSWRDRPSVEPAGLREAAMAVVLAATKHTPEIIALNHALAAALLPTQASDSPEPKETK